MASPTINQIAQVANQINTQAYGSDAQQIDVSNFVSVAQTQLLQNYDILTSAISQVLSKTIFSTRAYDGAFRGLQKDAIKWGNHVRKINYMSMDLLDNDEYKNDVTDGSGGKSGQQDLNGDVVGSVDPWKIRPQGVLQTNFYDGATYSTWGTFWKDQLDQAFSGVDEFGAYIAGLMNERRNELVSTRENLSRTALLNLIAGVLWSGTLENTATSLGEEKKQVIHLLTEYNGETGQKLTNKTVYTGENYKNFMQWVYAKIATTMKLLEFRSNLYHFSIVNPRNLPNDTTGVVNFVNLKRHTPRNLLHLYILSDFVNKSETMALSNTFHDDYLKNIGDYETVPFWQSPSTPKTINLECNVLNKSSEEANATTQISKKEVTSENVVGVMFDDEAIGITQMNQWQASTPMNPRGGYSNYFWHETSRYWNDFTENVIVLCLD
jgi:hypothetical protein